MNKYVVYFCNHVIEGGEGFQTFPEALASYKARIAEGMTTTIVRLIDNKRVRRHGDVRAFTTRSA